MDDLVAALSILANKLGVDVDELSGSFVLYTRMSAIAQFVIYMICAYVAYRVIDYVYTQYLKGNPIKLVEARLPTVGTPLRIYKEKEYEVLVDIQASVAKIVRVVLMALIMGSFLISAARQISTIANPEGAALESVMATLKDATKVEIVQPKTRSSGKDETKVVTNNSEKGND